LRVRDGCGYRVRSAWDAVAGAGLLVLSCGLGLLAVWLLSN